MRSERRAFIQESQGKKQVVKKDTRRAPAVGRPSHQSLAVEFFHNDHGGLDALVVEDVRCFRHCGQVC